MTMELEGNILLERTHTRRWVSIIAVVIPVAAFVLVTAWFVRVYIVPPTVAVWNPMTLASAPPEPPAAERMQAEVAQSSITKSEATASRAGSEQAQSGPALPMLATLATVPPALNAAPAAFADPTQDVSPVRPTFTASETDLEASEPIAGPIPMPRAKPHGPMAFFTGAVPLPRPKPADETSAPDLPAIDRHAVP